MITQAETLRALRRARSPPTTGRYTAGTAMLETAERLTAVEKEPALRQFLLLVGGTADARRAERTTRGWCSTRSCCGRWRSPATRRRFEDCARCGAEAGPHRRVLRRPAAGRCAPGCRPPGSACPAARTLGCWRAARRRLGPRPTPATRGTGARAAAWSRRYLQWHLERGCGRCAWSSASVERARGQQRSGAGSADAVTYRPDPHPSGAAAAADPARAGARATSRSSWTATAGGPSSAGCRAPQGHEAGEALAVRRASRAPSRSASTCLSAYAFSTENWKRSPDEVRFLMGFNRDVIRRRRDEMHELGVRVRLGRPAAAAVAQRHQRAARSPRR